MPAQHEVAGPSVAPQYIEEVEALLQAPFFPDEERSEALYYDFSALQPQDIATRSLAYVQGLRILATARAQERRNAHQQPQSVPDTKNWNTRWLAGLTLTRIRNLNQVYNAEVAEAVECLETAKSLEETVHEKEFGGTKDDELRPLQRLYVDDALQLLNQKPRQIKRLVQGEMGTFSVQGVNLIGPTGFGKTAINGVLTKELNIGKPHETAPHRRRRRQRETQAARYLDKRAKRSN